ncbi:MAG: serine hydrolase [Spirochaetaceae bacterium]|nr:serine hydrolase [Spirochaetaceae bacterium]
MNDANPVYLSIAETDPTRMGWMRGFPPVKEKIISATDGSFFEFPALRYSVNHMRQFLPTREVPAAKGEFFDFKVKKEVNLDKLQFIPWNSEVPITWAESLEKNYTDGIIILHKGIIVYEKYFAGLNPWGLHAAMSVSKSFAGIIASMLITEGSLDSNESVVTYLPELKHSGFADATVQQVLDMTTAIRYSEDYNDPKAEIWSFSMAGNPFRPTDYNGPKNYYEYLTTVKKIPKQNHGDIFGYKTINTEVLGWIISRVTGQSITELLSEKIWKPMGAKYDGYYQLDSAGIAFAGGGFNLNLRDMAIFGELMLNEGKLDGKRIIPKEAVRNITCGGNAEAFAKSGEYPKLEGWSYKNMWWITNNNHKAYMARGVHGQAIYIDPKAQMVIVRFASNPLSSNKYIDPISIPAYEAVAEYLMK